MSFLGEIQTAWTISQINKEALGDFRRDFTKLVDRLSPAFSLDGAVWNDASRKEHGITTSLEELQTYTRVDGGYLTRDDNKIEAGLKDLIKNGKFQGWVDKIAIGPVNVYAGNQDGQGPNIRLGLSDFDTKLKRGEMLGLLAVQAAKSKALLGGGGIREYYSQARKQAVASIELYEKAAEILFDRVDNNADYKLQELLELAKDRSSVDTKKIATAIGLSFAMVGCVAGNPYESGSFEPTLPPTDKTAIVEQINVVATPTFNPEGLLAQSDAVVNEVDEQGYEAANKMLRDKKIQLSLYATNEETGLAELVTVPNDIRGDLSFVDMYEVKTDVNVVKYGVVIIDGVSHLVYVDENNKQLNACNVVTFKSDAGDEYDACVLYTSEVAEVGDIAISRGVDQESEDSPFVVFAIRSRVDGRWGIQNIVGGEGKLHNSVQPSEWIFNNDFELSLNALSKKHGGGNGLEKSDEGTITLEFDDGTRYKIMADGSYEEIEVAKTVTINGVTLTYGEDGVVTDMSVEGSYTDAQKAEKLAVVDPTKWGYDAKNVQIRVDGPNRFMEKVVGEEVIRVATWDEGSRVWRWDGTMMEHLPLFNGFAKTYPTIDDGTVRQTPEEEADAAEIRAFAVGYTIYLYNGTDKTETIIATFSGDGKGDNKLDPNAMIKSREGRVVDGWIGFKTKAGKIVKMKFEDIEVFIRGFN